MTYDRNVSPSLAAFLISLTVAMLFYVSTQDDYGQWMSALEAKHPAVYVTKKGERYHRQRHYYGRTVMVPFWKAVKHGYTSCETCRPLPENTPIDWPPFYMEYNYIIALIILIGPTIALRYLDE